MENADTYIPDLNTTLFALGSSLDTAIAELSAMSFHPYDIMKAQHFEPDHVFQGINDTDLPIVDVKTVIKGLEKQYESHQERVLDYLSKPNEIDISQAHEQLTALAELSGKDNYVVTPEKQRNYIELLELITSVDINGITNENCIDIIHKIGYSVFQTFGKQTVKV